MAVVLLLIIPIGVMLGGAAWSALMGFVLVRGRRGARRRSLTDRP